MRSQGIPRQPLAINGGEPVRATNLPYGRQSIEEEDIESVIHVLRSDWITTGPKVQEFEEAVASFAGAKYAVAFSSGTGALHGAAFAAGLGAGDEAITTPMTFCATANCVLYMGASPVFADICPDTLNIDTAQVAERITSRTKAILPVDFAGQPADLDSILELADQHGLVVIEDGAHALGATYRDRRVGGISHMTMFSFHPVKHITTGEGGIITTDDSDLARRLRMFRTHGVDQELRQNQSQSDGPWFYEMSELGYNYRLPDIGCALGLSQLKRLPTLLSRRREIAAEYSRCLAEVPGIVIPVEKPESSSAWHIYTIQLDTENVNTGRREIFEALRAENIGVNVHYIPVHLHPYYRRSFGYQRGDYPIAEGAYDQLITLPLFPAMTHQDVQDVIEATQKVFEHFTG